MAFQDFYRLSSHAVLTNDVGQVLLLKANYADHERESPVCSLRPKADTP